jgi:tRNA pseudouridine55 synthase
VSGFVLLDKPAGVTSTQAVARVRRALDAQKAGHAGTLDPAATGLLVVALGEATKTLPHVTDAPKAYEFTVRWGAETATDDAEGAVTAISDARPSDAAIEAALPAFRGDILQVPPDYSAVHVEGERAYDLARAGEAVTLAPRPLHVARLDLVGRLDADHAVLAMTCGKGGYVRAVARDLGRSLGCLGHVAALRRVWSGPFDVGNAVAWEDVTPDAPLLPLETALRGLPELPCSPDAAAALRHGQPVLALLPPGEAWASHAGRAVALGHVEGGQFHPRRVLALGS